VSAVPGAAPAVEAANAAIDLDKVEISFRLANGLKFDAVAATDLSVRDGEFVSIVGPPAAASPPCSTLSPAFSSPRPARCASTGARWKV